MKVGYISLGDTMAAYGLNLVVEAARVAGYEPEMASRDVSLATYDVLLVSCYWWEHVYDLVELLVLAGVDPRRRRPVIVIGGQNPSLNPLPMSAFVHYAVAGDGEAVIGDLLDALARGETEPDIDGVWWPGKQERTRAAVQPTITVAPFVHMRGADRLEGRQGHAMRTVRPVTYIEIGRGCPHRCRFCALSSLKPYRELGMTEIVRALRSSRTKAVCLFAPDRASHSRYNEIAEEVRRRRMIDTSSDVRLDYIRRVEIVDKIQFGLEGVSARLRAALGKPMPRERLVECMDLLVKTPSTRRPGHNTAHAYLIGGAPGETPDDYAEFAEDLEALNAVLPESFVFRMTINWFIPQPFTPLQFAAVDPVAPWRKETWWNVAHGPNRRRYSYKIGQKASIANPTTWLRAMVVTRCDADSGARLLWAMVRDDRVRRAIREQRYEELLRLCERAGAPESVLLGELPTDELLPWERVWSYERADPDRLRRQWRAYWRLMGERGS